MGSSDDLIGAIPQQFSKGWVTYMTPKDHIFESMNYLKCNAILFLTFALYMTEKILSLQLALYMTKKILSLQGYKVIGEFLPKGILCTSKM